MQNAELIFNAQLMLSAERRVSGSTGVHASTIHNSQFTILNSQLMQNAECRIIVNDKNKFTMDDFLRSKVNHLSQFNYVVHYN